MNKPLSAFERGTAAHQAGNLAEAERLYQAALRNESGNVDLLYQMSVLNAQRGRFAQALELADRALAQGPSAAQLHFHRAELLGAMGRGDEAADAYRRALEIDPHHLNALNNLADLLISKHRPTEAIPLLQRALALKPDFVPALNNRANAYQALGRIADALRGFDEALAHAPNNPMVLTNRATALLVLKRYAEAEQVSRHALAVEPRFLTAKFNLGKALLRQGRLAEALAAFDGILATQPGNAAAWCDRGSVLVAMRRFEEAWQAYDKSLALDPKLPEAWFASAMLFSSLAQYESALKCFQRVLDIQPENAEAVIRLGESLRPHGRDEEAILAFEAALRLDPNSTFVHAQIAWLKLHRGDWRSYDAESSTIIADVRAGKQVSLPLDFLVMTDSGEDQLRCAQIYAAHEHPKVAQPVWRGERYDNSRIRVAYMSADFRDHPVSYLIPRLLELHDRNRFEVYGFSLMEETTSTFGARVKRAFEHFEVVKNVGDVELARMLRDLRIDIAIDLMGPTNFNRKEVLSMRPCPIQVSYLGYPGTSGTEFLDYIIADAYVVPSGFERFYSEKIVRLPDTFQCTDAQRRAADPAVTRSEVGLPDAAIVYCCFNNSAKFSPAIFDLWMQILRQVPRGVLWLFAGHPTLQQNLAKEATARGIDAKRLFFAPRVEYPLHLRRMMLADVFLDTLPFNAGTNASDALWAGVPVVTRSGEAFASRMAGSLLHAIGMPELITNTPEEYVALAVRQGNDPALLAATKAKLAANRLTQPLFDTDRFRRHLEAAYVAMWERTQRGEPPDHLTIAPMG